MSTPHLNRERWPDSRPCCTPSSSAPIVCRLTEGLLGPSHDSGRRTLHGMDERRAGLTVRLSVEQDASTRPYAASAFPGHEQDTACHYPAFPRYNAPKPRTAMKVFRTQRLRYGIAAIGLSLMAAAAPSIASGQQRPDPAALVSAQREAMNRFAILDGVWRGTAWIMLPSGQKHHLTQTERVGPFLDGSVRVIEGRGYEDDGRVGFNALAIVSFDPQTDTYSMRSYAQGRAGDFVITPTEDGFQWEIPAGPMTIRYRRCLARARGKRLVTALGPAKNRSASMR